MSSSPENVLNRDAICVGASTLCREHCVLTPTSLGSSLAMAHFLPGGEFAGRPLSYVTTGVGGRAFRAGYAVHRGKSVLLLVLAGIAAITVSAYDGPQHIWEIAINLAGSACSLPHFSGIEPCAALAGLVAHQPRSGDATVEESLL